MVCLELMRSYWEPQIELLQRLVEGGEIGVLRHVQYERWVPAATETSDIRYDISLSGGSTLDTACYNVAAIMKLASNGGADIPEVSDVECVTCKDYGRRGARRRSI